MKFFRMFIFYIFLIISILCFVFCCVSIIDYIDSKDTFDFVILVIGLIPGIPSTLLAIKSYRDLRSDGIIKNKKERLYNNTDSKQHQSAIYDMDSLYGIQSIPVPAQNYNTGNPTKDCIYYVLQRKATEHKKNGHMDLAIACLRKSNELSDYENRPLLMQKDYFRLVKYLEYDGQYTEAAHEAEKIFERHPEFLDRRIANFPRIKNALNKCKNWHVDLVLITTNNSCPICSKSNHKIYSISGKNSEYPKLPEIIKKDGGFCPNCYISIDPYNRPN